MSKSTDPLNEETLRLGGSNTQKIYKLEEEVGRYRRRYNLVLQISLSAIGLGLLVVLVVLLWPEITSFYRLYIRPIFGFWPQVLGIIVITVIGFNLCNLKLYRRVYFGIGEILAGLVIGWVGISTVFGDRFYDGIAFIAASTYLVGRGFYNIIRANPELRPKLPRT